ncbi:MAG: hypothetical protein K5877_06535 [Lachnospiraceae bacterium]|nr:hypothetical protein [Lachnospiraceae bacterium]
MIAISEQTIDKVIHIPAEQIPAFNSFLDGFVHEDSSNADANKRIGIAKDISFPADFDDIDYGTADFFGLNE